MPDTTYPPELVLEGVPKISYKKRLCPFPGCVESIWTYLGQPVDYDWLMGVSGAAFRRIWHRDDGGNVDLMYLTPEPDGRIFRALGCQYRTVWADDRAGMLAAIQESMSRGVPAIVFGIIGPPEAGLCVGYGESGQVLVGYSYFQDQDLRGYYQQRDWFEHMSYHNGPGVMALGERIAPPEPVDLLRDSLAWAIDLARTAKRPNLPEHICGLAAYEAWADSLLVDEDYQGKALRDHTMVHGDQATMLYERHHAAQFLIAMSEVVPAAKQPLLTAADLYEQVYETRGVYPWNTGWWDREVQQGLANPAKRREMSAAVRNAGAIEARAVEQLEIALAAIG